MFMLGLGFVSVGLAPLLQGRMFVQNYWGGAAFAPIALTVGAFVIYLVLFRWNQLEEDEAHSVKRGPRSHAKSRKTNG